MSNKPSVGADVVPRVRFDRDLGRRVGVPYVDVLKILPPNLRSIHLMIELLEVFVDISCRFSNIKWSAKGRE